MSELELHRGGQRGHHQARMQAGASAASTSSPLLTVSAHLVNVASALEALPPGPGPPQDWPASVPVKVG